MSEGLAKKERIDIFIACLEPLFWLATYAFRQSNAKKLLLRLRVSFIYYLCFIRQENRRDPLTAN